MPRIYFWHDLFGLDLNILVKMSIDNLCDTNDRTVQTLKEGRH